jgi:hypothetical protein
MDWERGENYLILCEKVYTEIGVVGQFCLNYVLKPLRERYDQGERSQELYNEIMEVAL